MSKLIQIDEDIADNVRGGESSIFDLEKKIITSLILNSFMDSCFVKDVMVMHDVSSVECIDYSKIAKRDMLILDYELIDS